MQLMGRQFGIKPYVKEFVPQSTQVRQPSWASELMKDYFALKFLAQI